MKYNQELIDWFNNYFDNCYYVKHDDYPWSIFMFYDVNYVRQLKLAKLEGKNLKKTDITGVCLFQLDWKNKWFGCNYNLIMNYLEVKYSFNYADFQEFIMASSLSVSSFSILKEHEHTKMSVLTPDFNVETIVDPLKEYIKMSVLTPEIASYDLWDKLKEHTKMY